MGKIKDLLGDTVPCEKTVVHEVKPFPQVDPKHLPGCAKCRGTIITHCKLVSGEIVEFDISSETKKIHQPIFFDYLGIGVVHSVNGQIRLSNVRKHFWKRKG